MNAVAYESYATHLEHLLRFTKQIPCVLKEKQGGFESREIWKDCKGETICLQPLKDRGGVIPDDRRDIPRRKALQGFTMTGPFGPNRDDANDNVPAVEGTGRTYQWRLFEREQHYNMQSKRTE